MKSKNFLNITILALFSFFINFYSANIGVMPIDTFGFFDTGYSILNDHLPIRDYWAYTGITVDYIQSFFFKVFGNNWYSYVIHSSIINVISTLIFYFFLIELKIPKLFSLIYALSFAILLYPVSGTPFAYLHAYILSLLGLMLFYIFLNSGKNKLLIIIFFIYFFAFFSMQTPTIYIILILTLFIIYSSLILKKYEIIFIMTLGATISIAFLAFYLLVTKTNLKDLLYQYFLFPMSIAEGRIGSEAGAYVKLKDQLNFKRLLGDFKFIHLFFFPLIFILFKNFKEKKIDNLFYISLIFVLTTFALIYNQLLQANQIYIFSLIPILASLCHANIIFRKKSSKIINWLIILFLIFVTVKFHYRYNVDRKFMELEGIDKSISFNAKEIHPNLNGLNWITRSNKPNEDKIFIQNVIEILKNEKEKSYLFTHYQFFSAIFGKKFILLNRWYIWDNNSHPTESHKYFSYYKEFASNNFEKNKIQKIFLISEKNEFKFNNIKNYFNNKCFKEEKLLEERLIKLTLKNC